MLRRLSRRRRLASIAPQRERERREVDVALESKIIPKTPQLKLLPHTVTVYALRAYGIHMPGDSPSWPDGVMPWPQEDSR